MKEREPLKTRLTVLELATALNAWLADNHRPTSGKGKDAKYNINWPSILGASYPSSAIDSIRKGDRAPFAVRKAVSEVVLLAPAALRRYRADQMIANSVGSAVSHFNKFGNAPDGGTLRDAVIAAVERAVEQSGATYPGE